MKPRIFLNKFLFLLFILALSGCFYAGPYRMYESPELPKEKVATLLIGDSNIRIRERGEIYPKLKGVFDPIPISPRWIELLPGAHEISVFYSNSFSSSDDDWTMHSSSAPDIVTADFDIVLSFKAKPKHTYIVNYEIKEEPISKQRKPDEAYVISYESKHKLLPWAEKIYKWRVWIEEIPKTPPLHYGHDWCDFIRLIEWAEEELKKEFLYKYDSQKREAQKTHCKKIKSCK